MKKKKTYVLTLSEFFPKTHSKAGMPTNFKEKFLKKEKLHTIRANYPLWEKRIRDVQDGRAILSIRQWTGKPYASKQVEFALLTKDSGVGIQRVEFTNDLAECVIEGNHHSYVYVAKNDGLRPDDWLDWFSGYDFSKPLAIIHFTKFRY